MFVARLTARVVCSPTRVGHEQSLAMKTKQTLKASTDTCRKTVVHGGDLFAVPYQPKATGYKDPEDHANRSDKHNAGEYRSYHTENQRAYSEIAARQVTFREDGVPISALRVAGAPLMSPKPPSKAELSAGKTLMKKFDQSQVVFGVPGKDPHQFSTISKLAYPKYNVEFHTANMGIRADKARLARKAIRLS